MGKRAKTSRKGKKAWRANISTEETEAYFIKQGLEDRTGGPLEAVPSESLFLVDKTKDVTTERKTTKNRNKLLHYESILQRNSMIPALQASLKRKTKRKDRDEAKPPVKNKKEALPVVQADGAAEEAETGDIWEENQRKGKFRVFAEKKPLVEVSAVEVDAPGCSYNPTFVDHQDALGLAVAQEMGQMYKKELEPEPVPRIVSGFRLDEEDMFFLDADDDAEENEGEEFAEGGGVSLGTRAVKIKTLTQAELNRKARRREVLRVESAKKKLLKLKKDVLSLPEILDGIVAEQEEKEQVRSRRNVHREEKRKQGPPRLGKYKFKPDPVQVLLTDDVTGSLRKLKGCCTLLRDRFKSLQRRGILEPRKLVSQKQWRRGISYEQGSKGQKERDMHAAMEAERDAKRQALAVIPVH